MTPELEKLLRCPRCEAPLQALATPKPLCTNSECAFSTAGFPTVGGQPVLVDFDNSVFERASYETGRGSVLPRDDHGTSLRTRVLRFFDGKNRTAFTKASEMIARLSAKSGRSRVLVVGGGALGSGTEALYASDMIELVGTDVYASPYTSLVADGHRLPFVNECFDAVWIQAVLEHVLEPSVVVAEIFRVLRPGGLVYADTPFMQQVHERAYDFTRFTMSGHRWLFRRFEQIDAGTVGGAGTAARWSARYLWRALGVGDKAATLLALPLFWLRFLDGMAKRRPNADAASGVYFFGSKTDRSLQPKDMIAYYESQKT
jgi:SAM-dependent methyltransferase